MIVSPVYKGKKGHPVLFFKELIDEISNFYRITNKYRRRRLWFVFREKVEVAGPP